MPTAVEDIFVSYTADTEEHAKTLNAALIKAGMHTWASFQDLHPGQQWPERLQQAVTQADSFLILVSPNSYTSRRLDAEWRTVLEEVWSNPLKVLIPVLIGGTEAPPFLHRWVPLSVDPQKDPAQWTEKVLDALATARSDKMPRLLSGYDQEKHRQSLKEIEAAAEEMGRRFPEKPPTAQNK